MDRNGIDRRFACKTHHARQRPRGTYYYYFIGNCGCFHRWIYWVMAGTWDSYGISCKELITGYWWCCHPVDTVSGYKEVAPDIGGTTCSTKSLGKPACSDLLLGSVST